MAAGCAKVYAEKVSGARTDRPELGKLLRRLEAGDMLIVSRLDRLARSTRDLLNILHALAEKGAKFKSLHDPWCDAARRAFGDHLGRLCHLRAAPDQSPHRRRQEA